MLGNNRLRALPVWELKFGSLGGQGARQIATEKAKHDPGYQERVGIVDGLAEDLAPEVTARIQRAAKRIYRILGLDGYARIDFRLTADGTPYFIEANPNPEIAKSQEFAIAALHDGLGLPGPAASHSGARNQPGKGRRIGRLRAAGSGVMHRDCVRDSPATN